MDSMKMNSRMENEYMGNPMNSHSYPMPDFSKFYQIKIIELFSVLNINNCIYIYTYMYLLM